MTDSNEKLRAIVLSAVMILSVTAGVTSLAGAETLDAGNAPEPGSGVSVEDALINASSPSTVTIGYNVSGAISPGDVSLNFTVDDSGTKTYANYTTGSVNGTFDFVLNGANVSSLANGDTYALTVDAVNTTTDTVNASGGATIYTFGVDADNTQDQQFAATRWVEVADLNISSSAIDNVTVDLNGTNGNIEPHEVQEISVTELNATGTVLATTTDVSYDSHGITVELQDSQNASHIEVNALSSSSLEQNSVIDANITFTTNPSTSVDTQGNQTANIGVSSATITGDVRTTNNVIVDGATVSVYKEDTDSFVTNLTTDSTGTYTGNLGGNANYSVNVTAAPGYNLNNYDQRDTSTHKFIASGDTGSIQVRLDEVLRPTGLDVTPNSGTAVADNSSTITFTANVTDQNGAGLGGQTVTASSASSTVYFQGSTSKTTGSNGQATFTVFSNETQTSTVTISVSGTSLSETVDVEFTPTFREAQDGRITGNVQANGEDLEGATVYAVDDTRADRNRYTFEVNFSNVGEDTASFRIVDTSSGNLIDSDLYDVSYANAADDSNFWLHSDVRPLNASDSAAGNGFELINVTSVGAGDNDVNVTVTMLDVGNYTLQDAAGAAPADGDFSDRTTFEAAANLTLADAQMRVDASGQELVDTTDSDGDFTLHDLYTNENAGHDYLVIAEQAGMSRSFNGPVTVDPDDYDFQGALYLEDREAPPVDAVNITNVGIAQSDGGAYSVPSTWSSTNDSYAQVVPRDGSYDVIKVETFVDSTGDVGNGTVTLEVPDNSTIDGLSESIQTDPSEQYRSFTGEFTTVDNGTEVSTGEDTITLYTGDDGVAWVYLETDNAGSDLIESSAAGNFTGVTASLQGASATDQTNKTFTGVTAFTTGSLSGLVTDGANEPIPGSEVFLTQITETGSGATFDIEPTSTSGNNAYEEFNITRQSTGQTVTISQSEMENYDFAEFPEVTTTAPVKLYTDDLTNQARYTIEPAPSSDAGVDVQITGVSPTRETGQSTTTVVSNLTATSNIVIAGAQGANVSVTAYTVSSTNVSTGDTVTITATVENNGDRSGSLDVNFQADGSTVNTTTINVDAASTTTVSYDVSFSSDGNHTVSVNTLSATDITVTSSGTSVSDLADQYDANGDNNGQLDSIGEIQAVLNDWSAGTLTDVDGDGSTVDEVQELINIWAGN